MRTILLAFASLSLAGCVTRPVVSTPPAACAGLVPQDWINGVDAEPIPDTGKTDLDAAKAWAGAYVGQSGRLQIANGRTADAIAIFRNCEALVNQARSR